MSNKDLKIIIALDFSDSSAAWKLIDQLDSKKCRLKVGKEMFTLLGPSFVEKIISKGFDVFLDLKFHDIPNTVSKASAICADLGVWMINIHCAGGKAMMERTMELLENRAYRPLVTGVTVLTSLDSSQILEVGISTSIEDHVSKLAKLAESCGLDGIVCSPYEVSRIREERKSSFLLVTPGIRPKFFDKNDQSRIMTPEKAILAGADYLVIGRPITQSKNPSKALEDLYLEIN